MHVFKKFLKNLNMTGRQFTIYTSVSCDFLKPKFLSNIGWVHYTEDTN